MAVIGLFDLLGAAKAVIVDPSGSASASKSISSSRRLLRLLLCGLALQPALERMLESRRRSATDATTV